MGIRKQLYNTMTTLEILKTYFETGDKPTQTQFAALIDSLGKRSGWGRYVDNQYTEGSPFTITEGVQSALPNNKATVIEDYLPDGVATFYDGTVITPENVGDYYTITIRFKAKNSGNVGGHFDFSIDLGGDIGEQFKESLIFAKGSNTEQSFSIDTPFYSSDTFVANGGTVKIYAHSGNLSIYDIEYQITRVNKSN